MHHARSTPGLSDSIKVYLSHYLTVLTHIGSTKFATRRLQNVSVLLLPKRKRNLPLFILTMQRYFKTLKQTK
jgi:hypothetical protein